MGRFSAAPHSGGPSWEVASRLRSAALRPCWHSELLRCVTIKKHERVGDLERLVPGFRWGDVPRLAAVAPVNWSNLSCCLCCDVARKQRRDYRSKTIATAKKAIALSQSLRFRKSPGATQFPSPCNPLKTGVARDRALRDTFPCRQPLWKTTSASLRAFKFCTATWQRTRVRAAVCRGLCCVGCNGTLCTLALVQPAAVVQPAACPPCLVPQHRTPPCAPRRLRTQMAKRLTWRCRPRVRSWRCRRSMPVALT